MPDPNGAMVWCPFPDRESAREVAGILLDEKLIACANIIGQIEAIFEWNGDRTSADEVAVLFKTSESRSEDLIQRLGDCHPYDTPAIFGWSCGQMHPATMAWLLQQTGSETE
ncbi:divalent-cation tolerance protein CutA [Erythrobacter insulae]|uniref:Divalent-cation tolerance protein CutA n=1 Tax=Erythrobacter insulae TaxID=2584124 RepID=A0A547PB08_9SPHN|nr:divalent-cation tolerance protein CutA [Erythrobacter insulae]TRD11328.1 divalent-cation tolerance protein CutA [Erythrobacter insulae]